MNTTLLAAEIVSRIHRSPDCAENCASVVDGMLQQALGNHLTGNVNQEDYIRAMHEFVQQIASVKEDTSRWPITDAEKAYFIRLTINVATMIQKTEAFAAEEVRIAARNLSGNINKK